MNYTEQDMKKMGKKPKRGLIVNEADVGHEKLGMALEIKCMRHRTKALGNEADGMEIGRASCRERVF